MANANNKVEIEIAAQATGLPEVAKVESGLQKIGQTGKDAGDKAAAGMDKIGDSFASLGQSAFAFNNIKTAVQDLISTMGGVPLEVMKTADAYNGLAARIKMVTGDGAAFQQAFEGVQKVAIATNSDLEATGTLFTRLAEAGKEMGVSQQQALALTQTINQAIQITGGSAQASEAAITQLIQALQGGVLRGEEFNSMMEQAPRLAQALAAGLGVGTGELRKMAEQGQLTSSTVVRALQSQSEAVQSEFAKLPPTVGGALTNLGTAWQVYVGEVDKANGVSATTAKAINQLAQNITPLAALLLDAGKAMAALAAVKLAENFLAHASAAAKSSAAIAAETAAVATNTAAKNANASAWGAMAAGLDKSSTAAKTATTEHGALTGALGNVKVALGEGTAQASNWSKAASGAATVAQGAFTLAGSAARSFLALLGGIPGLAAMILVNAKDIGTWLGEFVAKHTAAGKQLAENEAKIAAANAETAKRVKEHEAAQIALNSASDKALLAQKKALEEAEKRIPILEKEVKATEEQSKAALALVKISGDENAILQESAKQANLVADAKTKVATAAQAVVAAAQASLDKLNEQIALQIKATKAQEDERKRLQELIEAKHNEAAAAAASAEQSRIEATARTMQAEALKDHSAVVDGYARLIQALKQREADLVEAEKAGLPVGNMLKEVRTEIAKATNTYNDGIKDLIGNIERQAKIESAIYTAQAAQASAREKHLQLLAKEAAASGDLVKAEALEVQAKQESIKALQAKYEATKVSIEAELKAIDVKKQHVTGTDDEKKAQLEVLNAQEQLTKARRTDNEAIKDQIKGIKDEIVAMNGLEGAFKDLGLTSDKELRATAEKSLAAFEKIQSSGQASAREMREAFKKFAEDAIKANDGVADEFVKTQASAHGLSVEVDATGKAIVKAMNDGAAATKNATGYMDAFKLKAMEATAELEKQNAALEKEIAAQEKANELKERAAELERKRLGVDKDGFTVDKNGNRIVIEQDTKASLIKRAKDAGLNDAQAVGIADQFLTDRNQQQGFAAGLGTSWSYQVAQAINALVVENTRKAAAGGAGASATQSQGSSNHTVTVNINGRPQTINTTSANDASNLSSIIEQIANAKNTASA